MSHAIWNRAKARGVAYVLHQKAMQDIFQERFCDLVTQNLNTDFTAQRMIYYLSHYSELPEGEIVDEMLAILSDRNRIAAQETNEAAADLVVKYCTQNLPRYYHADAFRDIQVLTPMQRGVCGAANLNQLLQEAMNPTNIFLKRGGTQYRLHDKVMQIKNDYDKEVFNGDIGIIVRVDTEDGELIVDFDGREVTYDVTELDELVLAYATTIHKAQGSEYPIVVMPFTMSHYVMLQRNLLYTGVTRAKKILVLIGEKKAISYAVRNETTTSRNTKLAERLRDTPAAPAVNRQFSDMGQHLNPASIQRSGRQIQNTGRNRGTYFPDQSAETLMVAEPPMQYGGSNLFDRLAPAEPANDGKQTPMKGHPVFIAQHATATCCRSCLEKWHRIPKGAELTAEQQEYVVNVLMEWIERQMR